MFRLSILCLSVLSMASCAEPGTVPHMDVTRSIADTNAEAGERLLASPPKGWKLIYQLNNNSIRLTDYIPSDESIGEWETKLSFEAHAQLAGSDPISILMGEIKSKTEICSHLEHSNLFSGYENNYPTSVRLIQCGENEKSKKGEINLIKAIAGTDYFYIVRFQKIVPSFERGEADFTGSEVATWSNYMKQISLCDIRGTDHECPSNDQTQP